MKLPVIHTPSYLSPTGYMEYETCPMKFYLRRMAGAEWSADPQGLPAGVGSAFDALLTVKVAEELGLKDLAEYQLETLMKDVEAHNHEKAIPFARSLFDDYVNFGCFSRLMNEGLAEIHPHVDPITIVYDNREVVIFGKSDFNLQDGTVLECKVNGAFSSYGASPHPGYLRCYYNNGNPPKFRHAKSGEYLEDLNKDWAIQLTLYTWRNRGMLPFRDISVGVEQIAVRFSTVAFASLRLKVSKSFQEQLFKSMAAAWDSIITGNIPDAVPTEHRCFKYKQKCVVADRCKEFKDWENDPVRKVLG